MNEKQSPMASPYFALEMLAFTIIVVCAILMGWFLVSGQRNWTLFFSLAGVLSLAAIIVVTLVNDPDSIRARQTDSMLKLARQTLAALKDGLNATSAKRICALLLPATGARGIVITGGDVVLGKAGFSSGSSPVPREPKAQAAGIDPLVGLAVSGSKETADERPVPGFSFALDAAAPTMESGLSRVLVSPRDVDLTAAPQRVGAAIVVPLTVGKSTRATLQFYYANTRRITNAQMSIADGLAQLLSTQMAALELEAQTKLATTMQLKALQNQINPHFLFNTLNTIAALIRTDPMRARNLLREFATFYRTSLKDPDEQGLILLSKEIEQTVRYFTFEEARFGTDRVALVLGEGEDVEDVPVPAFIIQPLVENAVRHALPAEGKLTIRIEAELVDVPVARQEGRVTTALPAKAKTRTALVIRVIDDGMGMTPEACENIMHPAATTGAGIAVKNVADRIKGYFGPESSMKVESALGEGTTVTLTLFLAD